MSTEPPIRVLINGIHAKSGGGVTYLRDIIPDLAAIEGFEIHIALHRDQFALFGALDERVRIHLFDFPSGLLLSMLWEQAALPILARLMAADLVFSPANYGPILAQRHVIMLRNSLAVIGQAESLYQRFYWASLTLMTAVSLLTARRAIAVSNYAADLLTFHIGWLRRRKVKIAYHGVAERFREAPISLESEPAPAPFLLAVSDLYIQKNLHNLIEAMALLAPEFPDLTLKIAGRKLDARYANWVATLAQKRGIADRVELLGGVSPDRLRLLYRQCRVFVFPSTVETFGNPLLEAMASGAPIASSRTAAMPEVLRDGGSYFSPTDAGEMAQVIRTLLLDRALAAQLSERALARSTDFSWKHTAEVTAEILADAVAPRKRRRPG
jgi:glycosyltransferase involved in cell wall biosynthesis